MVLYGSRFHGWGRVVFQVVDLYVKIRLSAAVTRKDTEILVVWLAVLVFTIRSCFARPTALVLSCLPFDFL